MCVIRAFCCQATLEPKREEEMSGCVCVAALKQSAVCVYSIWQSVWMCACEYLCGAAACSFAVSSHASIFSTTLISSVQSWTYLDFQILLLAAMSWHLLWGFQVPSVLPADIPWGGEGVAEVPLNRGAAGHRQPVATVSSRSLLHHRWKIPLLQPAWVYSNKLSQWYCVIFIHLRLI